MSEAGRQVGASKAEPIRHTWNSAVAPLSKPIAGGVKEFGSIATALARNPLGIIALFIVLVYGFACLLTAFGGSFGPGERIPLIYFLVIFPVLVLAVFGWLVSFHSDKLFAPSDFSNEENYIRIRLAASLTAASVQHQPSSSNLEVGKIVEAVQRTPTNELTAGNANHILWVDDRPENNVYERQAFEAIGLHFTLALSTNAALKELKNEKFAAIISDMGRKEGPREGYVLLDALRTSGDETPFFIYAGSSAAEHKRETKKHGGQGCTNNAHELFEMVTGALYRK
jgi:CheY-like chemotaxis protein